MPETECNIAEDGPFRGFSIIDSLSVKGKEEISVRNEEKIVKVEAAVDDTVPDSADSREEKVILDGEHTADDEELIVLDTNDRKDDKEANNSTLIITTEDILVSAVMEDSVITSKGVESKENVPGTKPTCEETKKRDTKSSQKRDNCVWVTNIDRKVKAADLKKLFSQIGKVLTAKILTNGKSFFGYVSMVSADLANKSIKRLNDTPFDGKKIIVTKERPDIKETKTTVQPELKKDKAEPEGEDKTTKQRAAPSESKGKKSNEEHSAKFADIVADLKKQLEKAKAYANRYKYKVDEYQRRHEGMRKKCDVMEKELKDVQFKMRNDRRKLNQDIEQFEKDKKSQQARIEADRVATNKELDEVKKLRENLKRRIEEFKAQTKKSVKRRSRSPLTRIVSRAPRSSPLEENLYRPNEKKRKREDPVLRRTPPPPPKLSDIVGKKRGDNNTPGRLYLEAGKRSTFSHEYDYRHKTYGVPQPEPRTSWSNPFPKDPRRVMPGPSGNQNFPPEGRYGEMYQLPLPNVSVVPRDYYLDFGKQYGPY